ncbi:MAG: PIG-L family deacetylase [Actinomycetota bacterium]|nr:PIG-L family deacetylase [Actinomycetota bacterium]
MNDAARTLVFVHAHPDDEALLTAGTMARAVAEGHRVVLVVATDGAAGLASSGYSADLAGTRSSELATSAAALGVARIVPLGYPDSGLHGEVAAGFAHASRFAIAREIAAVCDEEGAGILVGYDPSGGYGHPDHLQVHRATRAASVLCRRAPRLFEATLPREPIAWAGRVAAASRLAPDGFSAEEFAEAWTPRRQITHRVDVRAHLPAKRAALRAHASQASADGTVRTLAILTRLPWPLQSLLLGTEFYVSVSDPQASRASLASDGLS